VLNLVTQVLALLAAAIAVVLLLVQARRLRHARAEADDCRAALYEMEVAYDQAPLGMTVLDRDLRYVRTNRLLAEQNGLPAEAHRGKSIHEVVPELAAAAGPVFREVMRTGVPLTGLEFEGTTAAHPFEKRAFRESVFPVRDRHGAVVGVAVSVEDITERKRLLAALHDSEERERLRASELESVMNATPAAVFIAHDPECQNVTANAEGLRLLRTPSGDNPSLSVPGRHPFEVYADGVPLAPDQLPLQVAARSGREVRDEELEVRFDNGERLDVLINAVPLRGHDGAVVGSAAAFVDITAQKTAAKELKRQARHKDEFLAVLAHELRNPLTAIQAGLELLKIHATGNSQLVHTRDIMQRQMAHVVRLIDDLLDVARISSGKLELQRETAGVREVVDAAIELCRGEIEHRRHRLQVVLPAEPLYVHADRVRLTEVICNLLHNAVKYTPDGGDIGLAVSAEAGDAVIRVADNGVGIAPSSMPQLFTMFAQAEDARAKRKGGLGSGWRWPAASSRCMAARSARTATARARAVPSPSGWRRWPPPQPRASTPPRRPRRARSCASWSWTTTPTPPSPWAPCSKPAATSCGWPSPAPARWKRWPSSTPISRYSTSACRTSAAMRWRAASAPVRWIASRSWWPCPDGAARPTASRANRPASTCT
jgi:PAS domain S-box-containing protein